MKLFYFAIVLIFFSCSSNRDIPEEPDQFAGEDLFSEMSSTEKIMLGKWFFAYQFFEMQNGTDSISFSSYTGWPNNDRTDTINFYSTELVGYNWDCPYENPSKSNVKLVDSESAGYFDWCFPSGVNGWLIENDNLVYYRGYDTEDFIYYPIDKVNNDSIVFLYEDWPEVNFKGIDKEYAVFYKK